MYLFAPYASISFRRITQAVFCVNAPCLFAWVVDAWVWFVLWHGRVYDDAIAGFTGS